MAHKYSQKIMLSVILNSIFMRVGIILDANKKSLYDFTRKTIF